MDIVSTATHPFFSFHCIPLFLFLPSFCHPNLTFAKGAVQSANFALNLPLKCKSCTLEEIAVLRVVQTNPTATQNQMAAMIGKSERTVKSITVSLQEKGILRRVGGKRDGRWEITS